LPIEDFISLYKVDKKYFHIRLLEVIKLCTSIIGSSSNSFFEIQDISTLDFQSGVQLYGISCITEHKQYSSENTISTLASAISFTYSISGLLELLAHLSQVSASTTQIYLLFIILKVTTLGLIFSTDNESSIWPHLSEVFRSEKTVSFQSLMETGYRRIIKQVWRIMKKVSLLFFSSIL